MSRPEVVLAHGADKLMGAVSTAVLKKAKLWLDACQKDLESQHFARRLLLVARSSSFALFCRFWRMRRFCRGLAFLVVGGHAEIAARAPAA